jgi:dihydroorotase
MFDLLIRDGQVVSREGIRPRSLGILDGQIAANLAPGEVAPAREILDLNGQLVLPGLVDAHVHFREPGLVHKESFETGSRAAAAGGVTTVMVMPTDNPMTTTAELFIEKKELAAGHCHVDYALQAGLGPDVQHIPALADLGAVSFEIFMSDLAPPMLTERTSDLLAALAAVRDVDGVAGITPGDDSVVQTLSAAAVARGGVDRLDFARARPPIAEAIGLARACMAVAETNVRAHVRQVSCGASVAVLRALAPKTLSSEVTPHNLWLDEQELVRQGPIAKVVPPLRSRSDIDAVRAALREGIIGIVATDHAPHLPSEKAEGLNDIWKAPGGFPGLQTFLPLMLGLVADDILTYQDLVRVCCEAPARRFGLFPRKGSLDIGADADIVVIDPQHPFIIRNADQQSKAAQTPFDGWKTPATPTLALLRGVVIMRNGRPEGRAQGQFLSPSV